MKGFTREDPRVALCGLNCLLCQMNVGGYCPGCGGGAGQQSCPKAKCARDRGIFDFCAACKDYPCEKYEGVGQYDSFLPTSRMRADMERVQRMGMEAYTAELEEKRAILDYLLEHWNDGRRKGLYLTAVYLLELEELRGAVEGVRMETPGDEEQKARAAKMAAALQRAAAQRGISLKLNKKPKQR